MAVERFKGVRLEIATALYGRWLTLYQTAVAVGRRSGDIQKALRQMHAEEVLVAEDEEPERGTRFRLAEEFEEALAEALRANQIPGLLEVGQDFLVLRAPSRTVLNSVFARGDAAAVVSWAMRLGSANEMLVAVAANATEVDYVRLLTVLEQAGVEVGSHRAGPVSDARQLRAGAVAAREALAVGIGDEA